MSAAISARYGVACPICGAGPNEACRTLKTKRVTDTHKARIDLWLDRWLSRP